MRTIEFKLYLTQQQVATLESWMRTCCEVYNRALEHRIKAYRRRGESITYADQQLLLTQQRSRIDQLQSLPAIIERDALRRVDRGMKAFFRRCKSGEKPVFPRFRSRARYNSLEFAAIASYVKSESTVAIPRLGLIKKRGGGCVESTAQKILRVIRRPSGWYGQVVVDEIYPVTNLVDVGPVGIDVGLKVFATTSDGGRIENPRFYRTSEKRRYGLQRSVSRKCKGSKNRRKAVKKLARHHEKIALQRRNFCHQHSTDLVRKHPLIAVEKLNIKGMSRGMLSKSIADAGWAIFLTQLAVKAENAGRLVVAVNPSGTSQTCPDCGAVKKKELRERVHNCECGLVIDRDHAAARVILARALVATGATRLRRDSSSDPTRVVVDQDGPMKQESILSTA